MLFKTIKQACRESTITLSALMLLYFLSACSTQQNNATGENTAAYPRIMERARKNHHNLIMRSGVDTFLITSVQVGKNKQDFTVHLNKLDSTHRANFNNPASAAGKQLRVIMKDSISYTLDEPHTIPFSKVARIETLN